MLRWCHVLYLYLVIALYYCSYQVVNGSLYYYGLKGLAGGLIAFTVVDIIGGYITQKLLKDLNNYNNLDDNRKRLIREVFFKKVHVKLKDFRNMDVHEKVYFKNFLNKLIQDREVDPTQKRFLKEILKEMGE
jgi:hypothetical protein